MKMKRAGVITKLIVGSLIVYAAISLVSVRVKLTQAENAVDDLRAQVDEAMQTNTELQYAIEHNQDPETIEDVARSKLGLVMPDEKIFYDIGN